VAREGSTVSGTLCAVPRTTGTLTEQVCQTVREQQRLAIARALRRWPVDLVHLHGVDFHEYLPEAGVPVLATLHLPPAWYPSDVFHLDRPQTYLQCVSSSQLRACPPSALLLPEIENGVSLEMSMRVRRRQRYALTLGRICPEKGFHLALDAARRARTPCLLAGQVFPYEAHERYFRQEIVPRLDRSRRFIGPVGRRRKPGLLAAARCLLAPSLAPETSSLVAMEALACGAPVVAFRVGALPEVVADGETGFLVDDVEEMAQAMTRVDALDRDRCRREARRRFSQERMTTAYLELYAKIARRRALAR
jgi:glycosyltransferase involved in cell wall biosynthesis